MCDAFYLGTSFATTKLYPHLNQDVCIEDEDYDNNFVAQSLHLGINSQKSSQPLIKGFGNCVLLSSPVLFIAGKTNGWGSLTVNTGRIGGGRDLEDANISNNLCKIYSCNIYINFFALRSIQLQYPNNIQYLYYIYYCAAD